MGASATVGIVSDDARYPAVPDPEDAGAVVRASDADREALVARLQTALGEGRIDLDEFGQRAGAAYAAVTTAELAVLVADLPAEEPVEIVGSRAPEEQTSVFGDIKVSGPSVPLRVSTVFGDVRMDLRGLRTGADRLDLHLTTVFGDVDVVVAEGVDAEILGRTVFGDRKVDLAPVPGCRAPLGSSSTPAPCSATSGCAASPRGSRPAAGGRSWTGSPSGGSDG